MFSNYCILVVAKQNGGNSRKTSLVTLMRFVKKNFFTVCQVQVRMYCVLYTCIAGNSKRQACENRFRNLATNHGRRSGRGGISNWWAEVRIPHIQISAQSRCLSSSSPLALNTIDWTFGIFINCTYADRAHGWCRDYAGSRKHLRSGFESDLFRRFLHRIGIEGKVLYATEIRTMIIISCFLFLFLGTFKVRRVRTYTAQRTKYFTFLALLTKYFFVSVKSRFLFGSYC